MSSLYIGGDLGTSALKLVLIDAEGQVIRSQTESYPINFPAAGWAEQNPEDWYQAFVRGLKELIKGLDTRLIKGIGFAGQMHGLVMLDSEDRVIRPAILWNDGRSQKQTITLNQSIGKKKLMEWTGNIAFAGFTAPKLMWIKENEPKHFGAISKIMLPKDYLVYHLTKKLSTDVSDASGTLLFNVQERTWSLSMLEICGVHESNMPKIYESIEIVGYLAESEAEKLGLSRNTFVIAGASDNAAAAIATATVGDGFCSISLGTSGTVLLSTNQYQISPNPAIHNFAHADGRYHYLGCILSAASAYQWWIKSILQTDFGESSEVMQEQLGQSKVFFLPYLMGERSPHNDPYARASFIGLNSSTRRQDMSLAVLEGVVYALRDSVDALRSLGIPIHSATLVGGGAKNEIWQEIVANILNIDINLLAEEGGPALGVAMLASCAGGEFESLQAACDRIVHKTRMIHPNPTIVARYDRNYVIYKKLYPALEQIFPQIACI